MDNKFKDFDEFFSEQEKVDDIKIRLFGKDYYCPGTLPAEVVLKTQSLLKRHDKVMAESDQLEIAMLMIGQNNVEEWCEKGLSMDQLGDIIEWVANQHNQYRTSNGKAQKK